MDCMESSERGQNPALGKRPSFDFGIENLVVWARSESNGFAGTDCKLFWSTGVLVKTKARIST